MPQQQQRKARYSRVAVFGCLHGRMAEMYETVRRQEQQTKTKIDFIIACGDVQTVRHQDDLQCVNIPRKYYSLGDFHDYYSGAKQVPKLTIFVGGNHEVSNYLMTMPYGGWVCKNFYYLGYAGVIRLNGLRIAGVSGIYNFRNCNRGRYECLPFNDESIRSIYHTRRLDVFRLQLLAQNAQTRDPIDVFLSHDWPARIYNHGNLEQLLRFKPAFRADVNSRYGLGNPMTEPLVNQLKPERWFAAHLHCKFYAVVEHDRETRRCTEFLSLNKIEGNRRFVDYLDLKSSRKMIDDCQWYDSTSKSSQPSSLSSSQPSTDSEKQHDKTEAEQQQQQQSKDDTHGAVAATTPGYQDDGTQQNDDDENELYYDAEWLTILRKTICLESSSRSNVSCPDIAHESSQTYAVTDEEIQETVDLMNESGGLRIKSNFEMCEPVIYGRPREDGDSSIDRTRCQTWSSPQHEDLCARLGISSRFHRKQEPEEGAEVAQFEEDLVQFV